MGDSPAHADLFVVSAPSGTGKTTVVQALIARMDALERTVSHTTRAPRGAEVDGIDYHFIGVDEFREGLASNRFVEHAEVFGRYYGTARSEVDGRLERGIDAVAVIDWQGARSMREIYPQAVTVFVVPPSLRSLRTRLEGRGEDSAEEIERRLSEALTEASHYHEFDYVLVNDDLEKATEGLKAIVQAVRLRRDRQLGEGILAELP